MKIIETGEIPIKKWLEEIKVNLALMELVEKWEEIKHKKILILNMYNYWCESCNKRWQTDNEERNCPDCNSDEIRKTISEELARERGLLDN